MVNELYQTKKLVKAILEQDERARNSDSFLYFRILGVIGEKEGIDINKISIPEFLLNLKEYNFPQFETVRRTRQKVQHDFPHLAGNSNVESHRALNEETFREFARS